MAGIFSDEMLHAEITDVKCLAALFYADSAGLVGIIQPCGGKKLRISDVVPVIIPGPAFMIFISCVEWIPNAVLS